MKKFALIMLDVFSPGLASDQSIIAHFKSQEIMEVVRSCKDAVIKLQKFNEDGYRKLQVIQDDVEITRAEYHAAVQSGNLTPTMQQEREERLAAKDQYLMERQQSLLSEVEAYTQGLNNSIFETVEKAVKIVSDRKGYQYVFDTTTLMIAYGPDITKEVIAEIVQIEATTAE